MNRARGFTLVELLVVIAVVALLVAVLLPALTSSRDSARGLMSLSQMRQIGIGWAIYAYDSADIIAPGQPGRFADPDDNVYDVGNGRHYRPRWFVAIGAKTGLHAYDQPSEDPADEHAFPVTNEVFLCPVVPDWVSSRNFPYGYNYQFLGNARFRNDNEADGFINYPVKSSSIRLSAGTVMFASCMGSAAGKPEASRSPNRTDGSRDPELKALGGHGYAL
ncbi:MAG: prepilin-type N-terminal cleavage/methylation domain-containing protein, partial [Planctomycetota bacterium]